MRKASEEYSAVKAKAKAKAKAKNGAR